ncbi:MAG: sigma-54-dependent Fis family transcriptional regulator [Acidobacteria bacterium]|nr:sigma-54-dependent Fis family transcriptional regulator [Acidobacteriota bacterium]
MADAHLAPSSGQLARALPFTAAAVRPRLSPAAAPAALRDLVGESGAIQTVFAALTRLAPHARATLITGETGTGKSTIARALHGLGPQRTGAFQTAASSEAWPRLDLNATVFVPEVGEWPHEAQGVLGRALADSASAATGEGLHVIAATERDLREDVAAGRFRADLYYRVAVFELRLPPLRERRDDIPGLAAAFLRETCGRLGLPHKQLTSGATRLLQDLPWPGNLRELRNVVERASVLWDGDVLAEPAVRTALSLAPSADRPEPSAPPSARLDDAQHQHVRAVLAAAGGNKTTAAAHLGVSRRALYRLIDRLERRVPPGPGETSR